jgi:hypothetical protein
LELIAKRQALTMPLTTIRKQELINTHQQHGTDTGSEQYVNVFCSSFSYVSQKIEFAASRVATTPPIHSVF